VATAKINYRGPIILAGLLLFALGSCFLIFGPETHGHVGRALGGKGRLTVLGLAAASASLLMTAVFSYYVFRWMKGLPAVIVDGSHINSFVFPFWSSDKAQLQEIFISHGSLNFVFASGRKRVRLSLLRDVEEFVGHLEPKRSI